MPAAPAAATSAGLRHSVDRCPAGWLAILAGPAGLRRISLKPERRQALAALGPDLPQAYAADVDDDSIGDGDDNANAAAGILAEARRLLDAYFAGDLDALSHIAADTAGAPPFFSAAWNACRAIPPGETRSYQWLAHAAGSPRAVRAAGQAMAKNPLPLVIPCHRVIGSGGGLHGYGGGGIAVKSQLLALERRFAGVADPVGISPDGISDNAAVHTAPAQAQPQPMLLS